MCVGPEPLQTSGCVRNGPWQRATSPRGRLTLAEGFGYAKHPSLSVTCTTLPYTTTFVLEFSKALSASSRLNTLAKGCYNVTTLPGTQLSYAGQAGWDKCPWPRGCRTSGQAILVKFCFRVTLFGHGSRITMHEMIWNDQHMSQNSTWMNLSCAMPVWMFL